MAEHRWANYSKERLDKIRAELKTYESHLRLMAETATEDGRARALEVLQDAKDALEQVETYLRKDKASE